MTDLTAFAAQAVVAGQNLGQPFVLGATTIFAVFVLRGALTLANAGDAVATLQVVR